MPTAATYDQSWWELVFLSGFGPFLLESDYARIQDMHFPEPVLGLLEEQQSKLIAGAVAYSVVANRTFDDTLDIEAELDHWLFRLPETKQDYMNIMALIRPSAVRTWIKNRSKEDVKRFVKQVNTGDFVRLLQAASLNDASLHKVAHPGLIVRLVSFILDLQRHLFFSDQAL